MSKTPKSKTEVKSKTLFSYFQKTPTQKVAENADDEDCQPKLSEENTNATPKAVSLKSPPTRPRVASVRSVVDDCKPVVAKNKSNETKNEDLRVELYDLVWAKLEGHPWWPSLVCNHPKDNVIVRRDGRSQLIHVQFFDQPPTRGWVKAKFIRPFTGSDSKESLRGGPLFSSNAKCRKGAEEADAALKLSKSDRASLVVAMASSDSEAEDESMEIDQDNNSDNGSESEGIEEGKENETPPKKPVQKTPKKLTRSASGKKPTKRRRIIVESDDEDAKSDGSAEDNFKPQSEDEEVSDEDEHDSGDEEESDESDSDSVIDSPVKSTKRKRAEKVSSKKESSPQGVVRKSTNKIKTSSKGSLKSTNSASPSTSFSFSPSGSQTPSVVSDSTKSKLASFSASDSSLTLSGGSADGRNFPHVSLEFLQPGKVRDAQKRTKDDPDYDPRTLYVPESYLLKQTPAMQQWWIMKAAHYDSILFFKMGKFYELFHMDAMIAVNELGLIFMKGEHAHSGFPEIAYGRYSDMLIQKGYKVARVEQTETPDMMTERCKEMGRNCSKVDKVVKREICSVQTKGTKRCSFIDGDVQDSNSSFLLAVCEKVDASNSGTYGVCFVDVSIGKFHIGQFQDDRHGSRLRTLISHNPPAQVLYERGRLSEKTKAIFNSNLSVAIKEGLRVGTEFWDSAKTLKFLAESDYFTDDSKKEACCHWPDGLKAMISDADGLGQTAASGFELGVSALGAVVWYLRHCLMDEELLSMKVFTEYSPVDLSTQSNQLGSPVTAVEKSTVFSGQQRLVLDGVTLANLDVVVNSSTGTTEGTLLERIQHCSTPFGKRLFKQWLCAPLCSPTAISDRLNAVEDLMKATDVVSDVCEMLRKLPDLERLLNKIHVLGSARRSKDHPDSRAIFFEDAVYSKRKIEDFLQTLDGFKLAVKLISKFQPVLSTFRSKLLKQCVTLSDKENSGKFPDLTKDLEFFDKAFDHQKAKSAGVIKPSSGVNVEYDEAVNDIESTDSELNAYLDRQRKLLGCKNISYWGTGRNRFQMEIPESAIKNIPDEYEVTSQRKGFRRYQTGEIRRLLSQLTDAEERRDAAQKDTMRCVFHQFDKHYHLWDDAVQRLAVLDVLLSLAYYSAHGDGNMSRPELILREDSDSSNGPFIEIRSGRHPCISRTFSGGDFIPNDTLIGLPEEAEDEGSRHNAKVVLVTGPNMGGKSTLMRQVGTIVILAQLGCYVPAEKCRLTPVDRVFTRLGASDNIMAGESTFFVELSETSAVLQHATENSLVLLDELGRGTATYDGNAIACAVVKELSEKIQCRTLFSTHYHSLVEEFSNDDNVRLGHMACMVENENDDDPSQETITFLYQFASGACPKSYGFNAARLASIPDEVIKLAHKKAREFEDSVRIMKLFREVWTIEKSEAHKLKNIFSSLSAFL